MGRAVNMSLRGFQNGSQFEDVGWNGNSRGCLEDDGSSGLCLELPRGEDDNERQRVFYGANPRLLTLVLASILLLLRTTIPLFSNPMCINIEWRENVIISIVVGRKHFREIEWQLFCKKGFAAVRRHHYVIWHSIFAIRLHCIDFFTHNYSFIMMQIF